MLAAFTSCNFRMSEFTGAVLKGQLQKVETICSGLRRNARKVREGIADLPGLKLRKTPDQEGDLGVTVFLDMDTRERRDRFLRAMRAEEIARLWSMKMYRRTEGMFATFHRFVHFIFAGLTLGGAVVDGRQAHGDESDRPSISTTIDFLDYCFFRTDPSNGYFTEDYGRRVLGIAKHVPHLPRHYGMVELGYAEVRAHKLAKLRELAAYDFDSFAYSIRTHTLGRVPQHYGYNEVTRDAFRKRYGKDIWTEDFDREAWLGLRAEAANAYLAEAGKALGSRPLYMDCPRQEPGAPYIRPYGGMPFQPEAWIRDGAVARQLPGEPTAMAQESGPRRNRVLRNAPLHRSSRIPTNHSGDTGALPTLKRKSPMIQPPCRVVGHILLVAFCSAPLCDTAARQPSVALRVVKHGDYVFVRSAFSSHHDLVVRVGKGSNRQINFSNTRLVPVSAGMDVGKLNGGTLTHGNGDDATPWNINGTYIGGNHA